MNCEAQILKNPVTDTPIHEILERRGSGNRIFMKRDDLQPFSFGGNKVRIAWEFLCDMKRRGGDAMLLYGDRRSNLCRVLSAMCHIEGIPCLAIATSEHGAETPSFNEKLLDLYEIPVRLCSKDKIAETVDEEMQRFREAGRVPYYIYGTRLGTGNEATAASAYAKAAGEILSFEERSGIFFDEIYVPTGTGATAGGLTAGFLERGKSRKVTAVSISSRSYERANQILDDTVSAYLTSRGIPVPPREDWGLTCTTQYTAGGYGIVDETVSAAVREMLLGNAIALTPMYSGKAYAGMLADLKKRELSGKTVLFLHTGGLPLFFDTL